ncbi:uncharacterized protein MONBRDRAFT_32866 [Monosiga brevicollis MX1]|uniref:Mitochondrial dicarboxylate carrier n=1 Tax=Monosiga brevicollis TaxID=81824 RepID=A9V267_MONBE|nr:uncharacterized protein MONBRDRAFT_32866 [Monosiga brevicollis MX1]EDQ88326.1 predicted protein [Monosiga brevicollis MX1]|eukprot:XP_001746919.1 hypothetical protein [Monosiga brevicollis MX1]
MSAEKNAAPVQRGFGYLMLGGTASMMAASCTHPLDLLKVRMQTNTSATRGTGVRPPGLVTTCTRLVAAEGITGLYRGLTASLLRQGTYSTTRFAAYDWMKMQVQQRQGRDLNTPERFAVGMAAGGLGGLVGTPADVCNVRMQDDGRLPVEQRRGYKNVFDALFRIARTEGVGSLYAGLGPNVQRAMLMTAGQIASYDTCKSFLLKGTGGLFQDNLITHFTASSMAGVVATLLTQPFDVIKTRIMAAPKGTYASAFACGASTVKAEGVLALYKGTLPAFARLGPQTILTFVFLEQLRKFYRQVTKEA